MSGNLSNDALPAAKAAAVAPAKPAAESPTAAPANLGPALTALTGALAAKKPAADAPVPAAAPAAAKVRPAAAPQGNASAPLRWLKAQGQHSYAALKTAKIGEKGPESLSSVLPTFSGWSVVKDKDVYRVYRAGADPQKGFAFHENGDVLHNGAPIPLNPREFYPAGTLTLALKTYGEEMQRRNLAEPSPLAEPPANAVREPVVAAPAQHAAAVKPPGVLDKVAQKYQDLAVGLLEKLKPLGKFNDAINEKFEELLNHLGVQLPTATGLQERAVAAPSAGKTDGYWAEQVNNSVKSGNPNVASKAEQTNEITAKKLQPLRM